MWQQFARSPPQVSLRTSITDKVISAGDERGPKAEGPRDRGLSQRLRFTATVTISGRWNKLKQTKAGLGGN